MKGKSCDWPYCPWCKLNLEELKVEVEETMTRPRERTRLEALRISSRVQRVKSLGGPRDLNDCTQWGTFSAET